MKTLLSLALLLPLALHAQVLNPGGNVLLFPDPPTSPTLEIGSLAWVYDPDKSIAWLSDHGLADYAYVMRDTTGLVVEPMDDFVEPYSTSGIIWQETSNLPEQVWLRVVLTDDLLVPGDAVGDYALRSVRFGFDRPGAGPFEVPEPRHIALLAGIGLVGFAAYRRF